MKVRHADGRLGKIASEYGGFLHVGLSIDAGDGKKCYVQLNSDGPDSGEKGWSWYCENFSGGPRWIALGDHNKSESI